MADKDKQPQQADFDKAFEDMKAGKIQPPRNDDSGPLPPKKESLPDPKKGALEGGLKGMGGEALGMKKGGTASARADGIAIRGKTRGTIAAMCGGGYMKGKK